MMEAPTDAVDNRFDKFTKFPELPVELRLIIWNLALPNGDANDGNRTICLVVNVKRSTRKGCLEVTFSPDFLPTHYIPLGDVPQRCLEVLSDGRDTRDVGMLRACAESREIYLIRFNRTLPAGNGGVIRFDDQTTVQINERSAGSLAQRPPITLRRFNTDIFQENMPNMPIPVFDTVQKLAVVDPRFSAHFHSQGQKYLQLFSGIESINLYHGSTSRFSTTLRDAVDLTSYKNAVDLELPNDERCMRERFTHWRPDEACPTIKAFACRDEDMKVAEPAEPWVCGTGMLMQQRAAAARPPFGSVAQALDAFNQGPSTPGPRTALPGNRPPSTRRYPSWLD